MRDPNRVYGYCNRLAKVWRENCPDWRFGQFMSNMLGEYYAATKKDPFFPEDEELISFIEKWFEERRK